MCQVAGQGDTSGEELTDSSPKLGGGGGEANYQSRRALSAAIPRIRLFRHSVSGAGMAIGITSCHIQSQSKLNNCSQTYPHGRYTLLAILATD